MTLTAAETAELLAECRRVLETYPIDHQQRQAIQEQIEELERKG